LTVISKKVPYEFFLSLPCLSRKRKTALQEREEKEKRERDRERKETILEINSKIAVRFLVPFLFNLIPTERTGCLSIWS
jgi:hypothetical protein